MSTSSTEVVEQPKSGVDLKNTPEVPHPLSSYDKALIIWLSLGLVWFLAGLAWIPTTKPYRQGLVLFLWLPTIICLFSQWQILRSIFMSSKSVLIPLMLFLLWAMVSMLWSPQEGHVSGFRRILYISLFICAIFFLSYTPGNWRLAKLITASAYGLAVAALVSILLQYVFQGHALSTRLSGIGNLEHPILGGYVIGLMLLWLSTNLPRRWPAKTVAFIAMSVMFLFVLLTQSRGLWVALIGAVVCYSILKRNRHQWALVAGLLLIVILGYWLFGSYITARGTSFRPEIFIASLKMILESPWLGLGFGANYDVTVGRDIFSHSHNLFAHVAIELGLPGLALWLTIWIYSLRTAWRYHDTVEGAALLKLLIFCSIALLFDGGSLLKTPRPEWFLSWLPVALTIGFDIHKRLEKPVPDNRNQEHQSCLAAT